MKVKIKNNIKFIIPYVAIAMLIISIVIVFVILVNSEIKPRTKTITDLTTGIVYENVKISYYESGAITFEYNEKTYYLSNYSIE